MTSGESRQKRIARLQGGLSPLYRSLPDSTLSRLPGAPKLLPGECFSSWFLRIQTGFRLPTGVLQTLFRVKASSYWMDAGIEELDIEAISGVVMCHKERLEPLLWPRGSLLSASHLACLTTAPLRQRPIYRYCEHCLRGDAVPYIRQLWRIACTYVCPLHGTVLRELCPKCQKPYVLPNYRVGFKEHQLLQCSACQADICDVTSVTPPDELRYVMLSRQAQLLQLIAAGSELMQIWKDVQMHAASCLTTDSHGLVDLSSEMNVHALFSRALSHCLHEGRNTEQQDLEDYLWRLRIQGADGQSSCIPIGLDGMRVFGKYAVSVFMQLIGCHDLWGSTHWWPTGSSRTLSDLGMVTARAEAKAAEWYAAAPQRR